MGNGIEHDIDDNQANELYWSSDESVNRIADRLGLSKGSLYAAIKPKPVDSLCPVCRGQLGYANRTALERGTLSCSECTHEFSMRPDRTPKIAPLPEATPTDTPGVAEPPLRPRTGPRRGASVEPERSASKQWVLGTTLLALGTGLLVQRLMNRD